uniref:Uncharacterized protein n=1 Tax=Lotus japonicus TaxID=34305 RepID=I3T2F4_LOTJA|nr:unknown [Lotus japonicus]
MLRHEIIHSRRANRDQQNLKVASSSFSSAQLYPSK